MILPKKTDATDKKDNLENLTAGFAKQVNSVMYCDHIHYWGLIKSRY